MTAEAATTDAAGLRAAYAEAGVDVEAGDRAVTLLRDRLGRTGDLLGGLGGFAAAVPLPEGLRRPVVLTATDGVGTKTELARLLGRLDTIGQDLVAMCADDLLCHGARPWLFLDYLAVGRVEPDRVAVIVGGVAAAAERCGATLVGGETAEHPGLMAPDAFDLAGFCVGLAERDELIDGSAARAGDAVVGLASSGLHANGFSLVRALLADDRLHLGEPMDDGGTVGEALLEPTRLYAAEVPHLLEDLRAAGLRVGGIAHVTGGGLPGNLPRAVGTDLGVRVRPSAWPVPPIVSLVAERAGLDGASARATFNGGIGLALVVAPEATDSVRAWAEPRGLGGWRIGSVVPAGEVGAGRYREVA